VRAFKKKKTSVDETAKRFLSKHNILTQVSHVYTATCIQHQHQMVTKHPQALVSVIISVLLLTSLFLKYCCGTSGSKYTSNDNMIIQLSNYKCQANTFISGLFQRPLVEIWKSCSSVCIACVSKR